MKSKYMIGIGIIVAFLDSGWCQFSEVADTLCLYPGSACRDPDSPGEGRTGRWFCYAYDPESKTFNFKIVDSEGVECQIVYDGVKPSNFDEAKEIVAKGRFKDDVFHAK